MVELQWLPLHSDLCHRHGVFLTLQLGSFSLKVTPLRPCSNSNLQFLGLRSMFDVFQLERLFVLGLIANLGEKLIKRKITYSDWGYQDNLDNLTTSPSHRSVKGLTY